MAAVRLEDNVYNRGVRADEPKVKIWSSAGLMLSYWCSSRCACCYVFAGPNAGSAETEMSVPMAAACRRAVRRLAGERGRVHITGGEPFGDYERLKGILQAGGEEKLGGLEKIETNCYWCTEAGIVRDRLTELKELGLRKLQVSTDVYHQEWVPIERVELAVRIAREVLGEDGVQVRWRDFLDSPVAVGAMGTAERRAAFAVALGKRSERLVGRATTELVSLFESRDYDDFSDNSCRRNLLGARHVHIDGAGNVFIGTCVGIIAGRVAESGSETLDKLWRCFDWRNEPIIRVLVESGPCGLVRLAEPLGYRRLAGYASKCQMCYHVRGFLFSEKKYREHLGPGVCYGLGRCEQGQGAPKPTGA